MKRTVFLLSLLLLTALLNAMPDIRIEAETGLAIPGYNDVRIPNDDANTQFSLKNELDLSPSLNTRLSIHYRINPRHQISLMAAPLTIKGEGKFARNIRYMDTTFFAGEPIEASYRFDSYRLQYRYFFAREFFHIRAVGASLKLRDAEIALKTSGNKKATKKNTGFVPLLSLNAGYRVSPQLDLVLEAEGLASPYGRAEDVFIGGNYNFREKLSVKAGYRLLEGGSDIDEVYTFSAVHYAVLGFQVGF